MLKTWNPKVRGSTSPQITKLPLIPVENRCAARHFRMPHFCPLSAKVDKLDLLREAGSSSPRPFFDTRNILGLYFGQFLSRPMIARTEYSWVSLQIILSKLVPNAGHLSSVTVNGGLIATRTICSSFTLHGVLWKASVVPYCLLYKQIFQNSEQTCLDISATQKTNGSSIPLLSRTY